MLVQLSVVMHGTRTVSVCNYRTISRNPDPVSALTLGSSNEWVAKKKALGMTIHVFSISDTSFS